MDSSNDAPKTPLSETAWLRRRYPGVWGDAGLGGYYWSPADQAEAAWRKLWAWEADRAAHQIARRKGLLSFTEARAQVRDSDVEKRIEDRIRPHGLPYRRDYDREAIDRAEGRTVPTTPDVPPPTMRDLFLDLLGL